MRYLLVAIVLVALLVAPSLAVCGLGASGPRAAASTGDGGMDASPGPTASAAVAVASPTVATPIAATARVVFESTLCASARLADRPLRPVLSPRSAPTILRV